MREKSKSVSSGEALSHLAPGFTQEVKIDNLSDPLATILSIRFGNILGELLDTVRRHISIPLAT